VRHAPFAQGRVGARRDAVGLEQQFREAVEDWRLREQREVAHHVVAQQPPVSQIDVEQALEQLLATWTSRRSCW